jgi:hypothetical protein
VSLKQVIVVDPVDLCEVLDVAEIELENHELSTSLTEFIQHRQSEGETLKVDAYKRIGMAKTKLRR